MREFYERKPAALWVAGFFMIARLVLITLSIAYGHAAVSSTNTLYFTADGWGYSEPVSVYQYANYWQGRLESGTDGFLTGRLTAGWRDGNQEFALLSQKVYAIEPNRDAVRFYHSISNQRPFAIGETFHAKLDAYYLDMYGIQFGRVFLPMDDLQLKLSVNLWKPRFLIDGRIDGTFVATSAKEYDYDFLLDYVYSKDRIFNRQEERPTGWGLSIDTELEYQYSEQWLVHLKISDAASLVYWKSAPYTKGKGTSDTEVIDDDGYTQFKPSFQGIERNKDFKQTIPYRAELSVLYRWANIRLGPAYLSSASQEFLKITGEWLPREHVILGIDTIPNYSVYGLHASWHDISLRLLSDNVNYKDAHYLQAWVGLGLSF